MTAKAEGGAIIIILLWLKMPENISAWRWRREETAGGSNVSGERR